MRGLHGLVMSQKVLYLGASDMPAWVVGKANACELLNPVCMVLYLTNLRPVTRVNGLTLFSVYQGL
jgi:aryl-alcohol dehydrogenase-like predicted oxidoreductase